MTITGNDIDPGFKFQVAERPGGAVVMKCFECGACAGICPMSGAEPEFDPRQILHMIKSGLKRRLLSSPAIWYCNYCDTCMFSCPQGVRFSDVVQLLRALAVEEGYAGRDDLHPLGTSPCKASCPAHISIQGFMGAIARGNFAEGLRLIKKEMPFPGVCGRVCPHPCETRCNRGEIDKPVAIMPLKRFLADRDLALAAPFIPEKQAQREEKAAVIGAGPAGLTVAYYLGIAGYRVTVFEKLPVAGGMMAAGIPEYRLPRHVLRAEIEAIEKLGVEIRLNCEVGKNAPAEDIRREFGAVFVGVGCHRGLKLHVPGEDEFEGCWDGLAFLREVNLGLRTTGRGRLVVVGGGNTAIDCARVAGRLGFEEVAILYRRTGAELPASPWEVEDAIEEGIRMEFLTAPIEVIGKNGKVTGVKCVRMRLGEPDKSGRRRPIPVEGSEFIVRTDFVVAAIGQAPDLSFLSRNFQVGVSKQNLIQADPASGMTGIPGVFAGGDAVSGPATVVEAVAFAKRAARQMDRHLRGESLPETEPESWKGIHFSPERPDRCERVAMPRLFLGERKMSFKEIDLGFSEEQACMEAGRCLRFCGSQKTSP